MSIFFRYLAFVLLLPSSALTAQDETARRIDLGFGFGHGLGGPDRTTDRMMLSGSMMLSRSMLKLSRGALVLAGNVYGNVVLRLSDCGSGFFNGCSSFPSDLSAAVMGGWTMREDQWHSLRLLAGPAYFEATDDRRGAAFVSRVDYARQISSRYAFVFWTQAQMRPNFEKQNVAVVSAGIGVRASRIVRLPRGEEPVTPPLPLPIPTGIRMPPE